MTTAPGPGGPTAGSSSSGGAGLSSGVPDQPGAKEQAKHAADEAAGESRHVAGVAKEEARGLADEAKQQARGLLDDARTQFDDQSRTQRDRVVDTLRAFSDDLEQMASQGGRMGMATDLTRQVAGRARDLSSRLDGREPTELLDDVRRYARSNPGTFLLGALAAGVVAGRLTRGVKQSRDQDDSRATGGPVGAATAYSEPAPAAGTTYPAADPDYRPGTATGDPVSGVGPESAGVDPTTGLDPTRRGMP